MQFQVPVRAWRDGEAPHSAPPQVQDGSVPVLPQDRLLPVRPALPLHPQRGATHARSIGRAKRDGHRRSGHQERRECDECERRCGELAAALRTTTTAAERRASDEPGEVAARNAADGSR